MRVCILNFGVCYSSVAVVRPSDSIRGASASMSVHPDGTVTVTENITDIHNYLQSFNKEIGESSDPQGGTTFYAIDTSQVNADNGAGGDFQTLALVPGGQGGYVLIVQQPQESDGSTLPASTSAILTGTQIITTEEKDGTDSNDIESATVVTAVKDEKDGKAAAGTGNDISVYDFDEVPGAEGAVDEEGGEQIDQDLDDPDFDEEEEESEFKTPKRKSKKAAVSSSVKKAKASTPATPSASGNQHMCNYCNYTSNKRYLLSRHMKSHSEERPHKCGICERGFKTIASLQNHVNTHTGVRPHGCKYCDSAFTTSGELVRHVRYRHTHEKPHRCTECDYASVELSKLKRHMRCHTGERPYQCPHCTYASPDTYKLKRHLRIHTGEKPYECDVCHARFTQSNSLKAHRLIHSGNKPVFKCELCPTTCGRKTDLRIHVQKLHTSEKPMTCKRCDQSFPDRYTFKLHLKSHEGEKCFKCDLCTYASVSARHLESHMLIHTDQKPFQCDDCEQSFRQKQLLKRHKNLYHNPEYVPPAPKEKTHECSHCNKSFRHKGNLMRHLVIHDPEAYKDAALQYRGSDQHQLIDDEDEESEEDTEDEDDETSQSQIIAAHATGDEESTLDNQTLQFTLDPSDPQTQQILSSDQVVVFEVVQMADGEDGDVTQESETSTANESPKKSMKTRTIRALNLNQSNGATASSGKYFTVTATYHC